MKPFSVLTNRLIFSRRLKSIMLAVSVLMLPLGAWAQEVTYMEFDKGTRTFSEKSVTIDGNDVVALTSRNITLDGGKTYVVNQDVSTYYRIYISGTSPVKLILCDGYTLTASQGIEVATGETLEIYTQIDGRGTLKAYGYYADGEPNADFWYGAPIGGSYEDLSSSFTTSTTGCGNIYIHGGQITTDASYNTSDPDNTLYTLAAGIGGCVSDGGTVEIYGGTINATGSYHSAGIGGGSGGAGGTVTIYGGTVIANGGKHGAGIGGGSGAAGGSVAIYGGTVTAIGSVEDINNGYGAAHGIGAGSPAKGDILDDNTLELGTGIICYGNDSENPTGNTVKGPVTNVTTRYQYMETSVVKYNLWIGNTQVTEINRNDILGDGNANLGRPASFTYNPDNNNLIVNSTTGYSIESQMTEGLTIYLAPKTESKLSSIIYTDNIPAPLTITTDGNNPGKLILDNSNPVSATPVISGFSSLTLDEERNLAILNPEGIVYENYQLDVTSAIIGVPMMPITKETYIQPNGAEIVPETGESDINKVVDNILYTLKDTAEPDGDGFDDRGYVVINTVTSDHEAADAAKNYTPGTEDFMDHLKGMTFLVPAGNGKIILDVQTMDAHILKVKVGDAVPTSYKKTSRGEVEIPYNVGKPTYVYLYNGGPASASTRSKAIYKGGKKTVTHIRVYKIGSTPSKVNSSNPVGEASGGAYTGDTSDMEGQIVMSDEETEVAMGDVDGDGKQTAKDIVEMVKAIMGMHTGVYDDTYADMDGDGEITISDIILIVNKIK